MAQITRGMLEERKRGIENAIQQLQAQTAANQGALQIVDGLIAELDKPEPAPQPQPDAE